MIGHVQSRKAEEVVRHYDWLHSLDSLKLARRLDRFAAETGRRLPVLLECNVSGEESKSGWPASQPEAWDQLAPEVEEILGLNHLEVRGLMTMAPFLPDPEGARPFFRCLVRLRDWLASRYQQTRWDQLSMGMSADFEVAVQEGATLVRVGSAILGSRTK
jgi:pyridoxal phosphate enzyme (YggS family)